MWSAHTREYCKHRFVWSNSARIGYIIHPLVHWFIGSSELDCWPYKRLNRVVPFVLATGGMNLEEARDADRDSLVGWGGAMGVLMRRMSPTPLTTVIDAPQPRSTSPSSISHESWFSNPIHFSPPNPNFSINLYYFSLYLAHFFFLN